MQPCFSKVPVYSKKIFAVIFVICNCLWFLFEGYCVKWTKVFTAINSAVMVNVLTGQEQLQPSIVKPLLRLGIFIKGMEVKSNIQLKCLLYFIIVPFPLYNITDLLMSTLSRRRSLSCSRTGFYMIGTSVMKKLIGENGHEFWLYYEMTFSI